MAGPQMLSLTVFLPSQHPITCSNAVAAYNWLGGLWWEALAAAGVGSRICGIDEARRSQQNARDVGAEWACYSSVSHGELVTADGRKLLGLAQIRNRYCTVLTSGVYLDSPNWALLASVVTGGPDNADYLAGYNASLSGESGVDSRELVGTLSAAINATLRDRLATAGTGRANN